MYWFWMCCFWCKESSVMIAILKVFCVCLLSFHFNIYFFFIPETCCSSKANDCSWQWHSTEARWWCNLCFSTTNCIKVSKIWGGKNIQCIAQGMYLMFVFYNIYFWNICVINKSYHIKVMRSLLLSILTASLPLLLFKINKWFFQVIIINI